MLFAAGYRGQAVAHRLRQRNLIAYAFLDVNTYDFAGYSFTNEQIGYWPTGIGWIGLRYALFIRTHSRDSTEIFSSNIGEHLARVALELGRGQPDAAALMVLADAVGMVETAESGEVAALRAQPEGVASGWT